MEQDKSDPLITSELDRTASSIVSLIDEIQAHKRFPALLSRAPNIAPKLSSISHAMAAYYDEDSLANMLRKEGYEGVSEELITATLALLKEREMYLKSLLNLLETGSQLNRLTN